MYVVILSTEATGPVELYRGTDWDAATAAFHDGIPIWMQRGSIVWEANGFHSDYGHGSIEVAFLCPSCGAGNSFNGATYCGLCGIDFPDQERVYRMASFFDGARAGRDDIAYGAYPSLGREPLTAPMFRDGVEVARAVVNIVGVWARSTYIVQDVRSGEQWIAFTSEIRPL